MDADKWKRPGEYTPDPNRNRREYRNAELTLGFIAEQLDAGGSDVTHVFTLVATDNDNAQSTPVVATVTVQAPPLANAGPDQPEPGQPAIVSGATITLDGSGSRVDSDRTIASWAWTGRTELRAEPPMPCQRLVRQAD